MLPFLDFFHIAITDLRLAMSITVVDILVEGIDPSSAVGLEADTGPSSMVVLVEGIVP